jgi:hypothetical protein
MISPGPDGRFLAPPLAPGHYALVGRAGENGAPEGAPMCYAGEVEFFLNDQDLSGIVLQFERGMSVVGKVVTTPGAKAIDFSRVQLGMRAVDVIASFGPAPPLATVQPDGTVRYQCIGPGKWRLTGTPPAGWSIRSALVNGRDILDEPLELKPGQPVSGLTVTLTDRPTELTGTVSDASGQPTSDYSMFAFTTDRALWTTAPRRISSAVRLSSDGKYRIVGLPPGEYYVTAITDFDPAQLSDSSFLESLISTSAKVTLGEGERKTQDYSLKGSF